MCECYHEIYSFSVQCLIITIGFIKDCAFCDYKYWIYSEIESVGGIYYNVIVTIAYNCRLYIANLLLLSIWLSF